ncbi:MAG: transposase [Elusimicrobiota bacterium]
MPRKPRLSLPGTIHHLTSRGNNRQEIYFQPEDCRDFMAELAETKRRLPFELFAYCLMPNHFHLLVRVIQATTSKFMQRLKSVYTHIINRRHGRNGHLFQGRFNSVHCDKDSQFLELLRYIHLNPVRAELVSSPDEWEWSGHLEYLGRSSVHLLDTDFPLAMFHSDRAHAQEAYRSFVDAYAPVPSHSPLVIPPPPENSRPLQTVRAEPLPELESIAQVCIYETGISMDELRGKTRRRAVTVVRNAFIRRALQIGAARSSLARFLSVSPSAIYNAAPPRTP